MGWRVLATARAFMSSGQEARASLEAAGCLVENSAVPGPFPEAETIERLQGFDATVASSEPYNARVFAACPNLKVVSRCGVGYDAVDLAAATEAGVIATNTPGLLGDAVADYTWALLLAVARRIPEGDVLMHSGDYGELPGVLVMGKTIGIVGFGQIGRAVARRAIGFDMRVLVYDPPAQAAMDQRSVPSMGYTFVAFDELLAQSDFVCVHAPNVPETRGMFGQAQFQAMKQSAFLVNTARGALVDEPALIDALEQGTIAGAALDVYPVEPVPADSPIRRAPNCVLTPHNAFNAVETARAVAMMAAENILAAMRGEQPKGILNPEVLERRNRLH